MSDEPLAAEPARGPETRTNYLIGGLAFVGGIAVTAAAFQLAGGAGPRATPTPATVAATPQPQPSAAPQLPPGTDIATLNAREQELAGRLDQLDTRLREMDGSARNASSYATRAERLMIAAGVRRAIDRGQPLGPLDTQLAQRFAERGDAVSAIRHAAAAPVTLGDLRLALETIAPRLSSGADDSMWMRVRRVVGDLVVVRQAASPSPRTSDRLRRARLALDQGDVETALAEVVRMPGVASAESWVGAARRYIAARQGLAQIEAVALETPPAPAAPARPAGI